MKGTEKDSKENGKESNGNLKEIVKDTTKRTSQGVFSII